ncbi:hypothetical protein [Sporosarcina luteola]|uniref:hypothetical protein n=1 Tax=Sporosarcina luteola TaxID=582850 RepID=UPI0020400E2C|nr:hypothetical protein [Sporosarcina luteola]MCM3711805.1 hypothetical protein [Sporosarcina luteola]
MKKLTILLLVLTIVGCSQQGVGNNSALTFYERIDDTSFYLMKERKDEGAIQDIINFLSNIEWESNRIKALNKEPNYRLIIKENDSEIGNVEFDVWISSDGNALEIINRNTDKYIQLSKEESSFLYNKISGKEL